MHIIAELMPCILSEDGDAILQVIEIICDSYQIYQQLGVDCLFDAMGCVSMVYLWAMFGGIKMSFRCGTKKK